MDLQYHAKRHVLTYRSLRVVKCKRLGCDEQSWSARNAYIFCVETLESDNMGDQERGGRIQLILILAKLVDGLGIRFSG
jgi:hypothetical protein